jgi:hypothetical protein
MASRRISRVGLVAAAAWHISGCVPFVPSGGLSVTVYLVNTSASKYLAPKLGVCPNGLFLPPHYFVDPVPVIAPGETISYTADAIAGSEGFCTSAGSNFSIGLCQWGSGTDPNTLTTTQGPYGGQIGVQFHCGDTVILRWSDAGAGGIWSSEVLLAPGNLPPTAPFLIMLG